MASILIMNKSIVEIKEADLDINEYMLQDFYEDDEPIIYEDYSNWIETKGNYTPAISVTVVKKMKKGIYKVGIINEQLTCIPQAISSDGLCLLPDSTSQLILNETEKFWARADEFKKYKMIHKRGILLEGSPGTGKSVTITLLIQELIKKDGLVFIVNSARDFSLIYDFFKNTLRKIEPDRNIITVIEDIDKLVNDSIEPEFLDFLDGKMSIDHHLVIATTNDSSDLSDAIIRPSRMDMRVVIGYPTKASRLEFFKFKGVEESDLEMFVKASSKFSMSQLKELFIGTYVLGNGFDQVVEQIKNPLAKQRYDSFVHNKIAIGF